MTAALHIATIRAGATVAVGVIVGLLVSGALAVLLGWANTDFERLWILLGFVGCLAVAAAMAAVAGAVRRRRVVPWPDDGQDSA